MFGALADVGAESSVEAASYFPELDSYNTGPDEYLRLIERRGRPSPCRSLRVLMA